MNHEYWKNAIFFGALLGMLYSIGKWVEAIDASTKALVQIEQAQLNLLREASK